MKMPKLPSPAMSVALLALFVALGGTSYAAVKIHGKNIKKGTIQGKALRKNTLTGTQIKESKLGKVPSAAAADVAGSASTATQAADAAKLGGLGPEAFVRGSGSVKTSTRVLPLGSLQTLDELPGLVQLKAACSANATSLQITALVDDVIWSGSTVGANLGETSIENKSGILDQGETGDLPYRNNSNARITIWRNAAPNSVTVVQFAAHQCRTALIVSTPG